MPASRSTPRPSRCACAAPVARPPRRSTRSPRPCPRERRRWFTAPGASRSAATARPGCASAASTPSPWPAASAPGAPTAFPPNPTAKETSHEVDYPRTSEDRPHRLSVADQPLHRQAAGVPLRAAGRGPQDCRDYRRGPLRHPRREVQPRRREVLVRRLPRRVQTRRAGPRPAGRHRPRRRHLAARPDAAEPWPVRDLAGPEPRLRRRPRDAEARHGDVRRALRLVPSPGRRDARLAAEDGVTMSTAPLSLCGHVALPKHVGSGGFDHAAVHAATGHVYVAHTANSAVDVFDPASAQYLY